MIAEDVFADRFRREVNDLGNLVRGLEMAVEYARANPDPGVRDSLTRDVRTILTRLPAERLRADLATDLTALFGENPNCDVTAEPVDATPANAVLMPFISNDRGVAGVVRRFWIRVADPYAHATIFPSEARDDFRRAIEDGCDAARRMLERAGIIEAYKIPEDYEFHVDSGPFNRNLPLREQSGWLAAAISYFSLHSGLPVPGQVAATGYITTDGRIGTLERIAEKIGACLREWPHVQRILVLRKEPLTGANSTEGPVRHVKSLKEAVTVLWGDDWRSKLSPPRLNVHAAMDRAMYSYAKEHDICGAFERFTLIDRFLSTQRGGWERFRFLCDWRLACCHNHLGHRDEATRLFTRWADKAESLWRDGVIDSENYANFFASYGYFLARTSNIKVGLDVVRRALELATEHWAPRMHRAKLLGAEGRLLMVGRDFRAAELKLQGALDLAAEDDQPRRRLELACLYVEWGRPDDAKQQAAKIDPSAHHRSSIQGRANQEHKNAILRRIAGS